MCTPDDDPFTLYYVDDHSNLKIAKINGITVECSDAKLHLRMMPISMVVSKSSSTLIICYSIGIVEIIPLLAFESNEIVLLMQEMSMAFTIRTWNEALSINGEQVKNENDSICCQVTHRFIKNLALIYFNSVSVYGVCLGANATLIYTESPLFVIDGIGGQIKKLSYLGIPIVKAQFIANEAIISALRADNSIIVYDTFHDSTQFIIRSPVSQIMFIFPQVLNFKCKKSTLNNGITQVFTFIVSLANGSVDICYANQYRNEWHSQKTNKPPYYNYNSIPLKHFMASNVIFIQDALVEIGNDSICLYYLSTTSDPLMQKNESKSIETFSMYSNFNIDSKTSASSKRYEVAKTNQRQIKNKLYKDQVPSVICSSKTLREKKPIQVQRKLTTKLITLPRHRNIVSKKTCLATIPSIDSQSRLLKEHKNKCKPKRKLTSERLSDVGNLISTIVNNEINSEIEDKSKYKVGEYDFQIDNQKLEVEENNSIHRKATHKYMNPKNYTRKLAQFQPKQMLHLPYEIDAQELASTRNNPTSMSINKYKVKRSVVSKAIINLQLKGYTLPQLDFINKRKQIQNIYNEASRLNKPSVMPKFTETISINDISDHSTITKYMPILNNSTKNTNSSHAIADINKNFRHSSISHKHLAKQQTKKEISQIDNLFNSVEKSISKLDIEPKESNSECSGFISAMGSIKANGLTPEVINSTLSNLTMKRMQVQSKSNINEEFIKQFNVSRLIDDLKPQSHRNKALDNTTTFSQFTHSIV